VGGAAFRVTAGAFFQNNTHGAEALVSIVGEMLEVDRTDRLLDGYAGVGLFAATIGVRAGSVLCVEADERALADLEHNLEQAAVPAPDIVVAPFEEVADDETWTVAVVDPPRSGLRRAGVDVVVGPEPRAIAYVSCDPAGLARDTRYLAEAGYTLARVVPVDMFPQTYHIEAVALFVPSGD
jgi:23S rRNA (uracil1939-C5)-methyltransferase